MRARLTLKMGDCTPPALEILPGQPATLGRSRDNSVVIKDDLASRMHAKIYYDEGRWIVRDFGLNGTRVAGSRINGAVDLDDGAIVQVGDTTFQFALINGAPVTDTSLNVRGSSVVKARARTDEATDPHMPLSNTNPDRKVTAVVPAISVDRHTPVEAGSSSKPLHLNGAADASQRKVDELTALCRYMTAAVETSEPHDLIRQALRAVLHQTAAKVAGYLNLDPTDPMPRFILPEQAAVDVALSKYLTERVRASRRLLWLAADATAPGSQRAASESLTAYRDAICLPLCASGETYAALHVYRTGAAFDDRDVRFIEVVGGYLARALDLHRHRRKLEAENNRLRAAMPTADELIGDSSGMMTLRQQIARAAPQPFTVLISGESGSGKELVAQALHHRSHRVGGPLVVVNCASIAPTQLEAELFGYRKGAFSGADHDHPGLFEQADDGTLFLDEVGELTLECQAKLLRVIEGKPFRPLGGTADVKVDVRVVAATHRDLDKDVKAGRFRQDLLFRLKVIPLKVPPLREHSEDVPELARFFLERLSVQCRRPFKLTAAAVRKLQAFPWPGNVRQLRAVLESAAVMCESDAIDAPDLPLGTVSEAPVTADLPPSLDVDELETWAIRKAMRQTGGNVSRAAQVLGMSRDTLHTKLKKKGIVREDLIAELAMAE